MASTYVSVYSWLAARRITMLTRCSKTDERAKPAAGTRGEQCGVSGRGPVRLHVEPWPHAPHLRKHTYTHTVRHMTCLSNWAALKFKTSEISAGVRGAGSEPNGSSL